MSLAECQNNPIDVNFHLQKVWKFLIKIQLKNSDAIRTGGWKVPSLMPIRVKLLNLKSWNEDEISDIFFQNCTMD